jgi:hypothetical protein
MRRARSVKVVLLLALMVLPMLLALSGCFIGWGHGRGDQGGDRHDDHREGDRHDEGHGGR